ncbi:MAG: hypothetical protein GEU71_05255 [Actinobacteria bacterium]|nr:hypothetical protein [Actinomycetota bacterium]
MSTSTAFLWGMLGGVLPDVLQLIQSNNKTKIPDYLKKPWWWVILGITILLGGVASMLLDPTSAGQAVALGFGGPEVLRRLAGSALNPASSTATPTTVASNTPTLTEYLA